MTLTDFLRVFWRRKLLIALVTIAVIALAYGATKVVSKQYESTSTLSISPKNLTNDLSRLTGLPVYAEVPAEIAVLKVHAAEDLFNNKRLRIVTEALRDLRTNLLFSDDSLRSLVVTSPDGSHGKTTISFGLAVTLAR